MNFYLWTSEKDQLIVNNTSDANINLSPLHCDRREVVVANKLSNCVVAHTVRAGWLMSKFPHWEKIKKLKPLLQLCCHSMDLDYTVQKIIHTLRQQTLAKLSGNAEFLCTA